MFQGLLLFTLVNANFTPFKAHCFALQDIEPCWKGSFSYRFIPGQSYYIKPIYSHYH